MLTNLEVGADRFLGGDRQKMIMSYDFLKYYFVSKDDLSKININERVIV